MPGLEDLKKILAARAGFEAVDASVAESQIRLIGRVPPNASSHWLLIVHRMLVACGRAAWKVDISRQYFLRDLPSGPKLFYAWRLIFQAPQIETVMPNILNTIHTSPRPAVVELAEFPLPGGDTYRKSYANGKGAYSAESVPSVVMSAASRKGGGG